MPPAPPTRRPAGLFPGPGGPTSPLRITAPPRPFLQAIWGLILVGLLVRVLRAPTLPGTYHAELDTLLYSGQRLLHGQWLYQGLISGSQHLAQILFAPSAWSGSILAHRLLILALNLVGGALLCRTLRRCSRLDLIKLRDDSLIPDLAGALFVTFSQIFPSGLSGHLHQFANLFLLAALDRATAAYAWHRAGMPLPSPGELRSPIWRDLALLGLMLVLAFSSLMRLSLPVLMVILLVLVQARQRQRLVAPVCVGVITGLLLLFLPYLLLSGGLAQAWAGAVLLPLEWNSLYQPEDGRLMVLLERWLTTQVSGLQVWQLLLVPAIGIGRLACRQFSHRNLRAEQPLMLPALALVFILELLLSFQKGDFESHDLLLTITPLVLLICCGLAALEWNPRRWSRTLASTMLLVVSLVYLNNIFVVSIASKPRLNRVAREIEADRARVRVYLQGLPERQRTFASPQDVALLRQLDQPSATVGIGEAWSLNQQELHASPTTAALGLPTEEEAVCRQLTAPPIHHLVWMRTDPDGPNSLAFLNRCLQRGGGTWLDRSEALGLRSGEYRLFSRRDDAAAPPAVQP